jgi:hypothetical protein
MKKISIGNKIGYDLMISYIHHDPVAHIITVSYEEGLNVNRIEVSTDLAVDIGFINPAALNKLITSH